MLFYYFTKFLKKIRGSSIKNSSLGFDCKIESGSNLSNVSMGNHSFCGYNCEIYNTQIGSFCSIANEVVIGGGEHPIKWVSTSPCFYSGRDSVKFKYSEHTRKSPKITKIGHDVWIGQKVLIKQGVEIGTGSVVGMGSVVTKSIPPYGVVVGNPAKLIRFRFNPIIIDQLLSSEWWNLSPSDLKTFAQNFIEPELFLTNYFEKKADTNKL